MGRDKTEWKFDEDQDLRDIWPQVVLQYEKVTKRRLESGTTFKDFQLQIDKDIQNSSTKSHQHARKVLNNIGYCLDQFGSIIVQGASIVFGPAAQCWNAISFIIQAARKFGDVVDGFVTLMERSSAFIQRLNFFLQQEQGKAGSQLPNHLRKSAYAILSQFLGVLRTSYELATSKRERLKTMMGILLFNSDAGVAESLELMESRIRDFTNASVDQILVDVRGLAKYLQDSEEDKKRHQAEIQEYLESVHKISEEVLSVTQQMKATIDGRISKDQQNEYKSRIGKILAFQKLDEQESWVKRHTEIGKIRVKGTGDWLMEEHQGFTKWADVDQHDEKILLLKADSGYGKTHVSNFIISHLEAKYRPNTASEKAFLAYYYYGDDKDELERCIGSIIYQFAAVDVGYAKAVYEACGQPSNVATAEDRWNRLVLGLQWAMKGTYYICIDGFHGRDQGDDAEAIISAIVQRATASADSSGVSIRFFVSGTDEVFSKIHQAQGIQTITLGPRSHTIQLTSDQDSNETFSPQLPNAGDLEAVTRARVLDICRVKPDLKEIFNEANIKLLVRGIQGNYKHLEAKMTEINACDTERKVQDAINNTSDDMNTVQRNNVKALNASLNSSQVRKLNEILVWVAGMRYSPSVKLLQSVLYFTVGEVFLLGSEIATTYSALLQVDKEGEVSFKSEDLRDILSTSEAEDGSALTGPYTEDISQAEVDLCRRFIKKACDDLDYTRFKFDEFFNAIAQKGHVHLSDENVTNFAILSMCIGVLCDSRADESLKELRTYASLWFYEHLKTLVENLDSFEPDRQSMTDVGAKLVGMFYKPDLIDAWFLETNLAWLRHDWLHQDDFINVLLKFLKNPQVAKGYTKNAEESVWVKSIVADSTNKYLVLEHVAVHLARRWFSCTTTTDPNNLWISYGIVAKGAGQSFDQAYIPNISETDAFIKWAETHLGLDVKSPTWAYRVGATNSIFGHYKEAVVAFEKANPDSNTNWGPILGLARAHVQLKNFRESLEYIHKFRLISKLHLETDKAYRTAYWEILVSEGDCYRQCEEYEAAAQCYRDILDQDAAEEPYPGSVHAWALSGLFTTWAESKSYQCIVDLMQTWKHAKAQDRGLSYWFKTMAHVQKIHECIIVAARKVEAMEQISMLYQEAIDGLSSKQLEGDEGEDGLRSETRGQLQYFQAALRFHGSRSPHDHDRGMQSWEEIIRKSNDPSASWWAAYNATCKLAPSLLDKAVAEDAVELSGTSTYASRLEALAKMNIMVIRHNRQGQMDPRLCLLRLYYLKGSRQSVFLEAQSRLCSVFDSWPEDPTDDSNQLRYQNLAQTLTVLEKDVDAVAAWQAIRPNKSQSSSVTEAIASNAVSSSNHGSDSVNALSSLAEPKTDTEKKQDTPALANLPLKAYISGYSCDGECGTSWDDILADCWACKHCLCVQLCPGCYKKLQSDELRPLICSKNHEMLYLPPFDQDMWQMMPPDTIVVDKKPLPRLHWLNKIRDEYGVHQEQIDALKIEKAREMKAAGCIASHFIRWRRRVRKNKAAREPAVPVLRRARTVV